ncbi:conserved hypothetical protein [Nitrosopumilaceae archaeon]|nr:conserved hypothetical protein [Nitrosopumilaceae archaeon]
MDRTEFESATPRVQGGYTTRLYYRPTGRGAPADDFKLRVLLPAAGHGVHGTDGVAGGARQGGCCPRL